MAEIGFGAEGDEEAELVEGGGKEITESACLSLSLSSCSNQKGVDIPATK